MTTLEQFATVENDAPELPEPCPFCGCKLRPHYDFKNQNVIMWVHDQQKDEEFNDRCFLDGKEFGTTFLEKWNTRAAKPVVYYRVVDNAPVFSYNADGAKLATAGFLNDVVAHYKAYGST